MSRSALLSSLGDGSDSAFKMTRDGLDYYHQGAHSLTWKKEARREVRAWDGLGLCNPVETQR